MPHFIEMGVGFKASADSRNSPDQASKSSSMDLGIIASLSATPPVMKGQ
jgi:hypothetical protein